MKVLIIGGRRYLGPRLVQCLCDKGHEPVLFNRGRTRAPLPVKHLIREIHGDRRDENALRDLVRRERFDAVVDTQAFCRADAELAVRVLSGRVARYLVISSVACYGRLYAVLADENHPYISGDNAFPGAANDYAVGKRDVEQVCLEAHSQCGFPVIIIRPSVSYGYARLTSIWGYDTRHVSRIRAGKPIIVPDKGESLIQPIHIDDEAQIIERALISDVAIGEAFNCAGPQAVPLWQYFRAHGDVLGRPAQCVEIPVSFIYGFDPILGARAAENLVFNHAYDVSKLAGILHFSHAYRLKAGLAQTIEFLDRWNLLEPSGESDPEDWLVEAFASGSAQRLEHRGEELRKSAGYRLPESAPLTNWAPDRYAPSS